MRVRAVAPLLLTAAVLAVPGPALAGTARATSSDERNPPSLRVVGAPGETNAVTVSRSAGTAGSWWDYEWRVTDMGAPLVAGEGCRAVSEHEVVCTASSASASLGDRDDTLVAHEGMSADGGPGDDSLTGSPKWDSLRGGDGRDNLDGGGGNDHLTGDATGLYADVMIGGPGTDQVNYFDHPAGVSVNLSDPATGAGGPGEDDQLRGVENIIGTYRRASVLIGDDGPNELNAPGAGSRVVGGGGNDDIYADAASTVDAGAGDDFVDASGRLACGDGTDTLRTDRAGLVDPSCERFDLGGADVEAWYLPLHPTARDGRVTFRIPCPNPPGDPAGCRGRLSLQRPNGRVLATRTWAARAGRDQVLGLTLRPRDAARVRRREGLRAVVSTVVAKGEIDQGSAAYSIVLRSP